MKVTGTTKTAEVTYRDNNYNSYSGSVTIPTSITYSGETYSVTSIDWYAFYGCTGLTSIEIPSSVTSIGSYAFYGCTGLTSMEIPISVTTIFDRAFQGCSSLTSIEIPNSVTSIGNYAFSGCSGLTSIEIPSSITIIGSYAFSNCTGLTSVHITDLSAWCKISFNYQESNPLWYAKHLFMDGKEITDLVIPNSVTSIGSYAFSGCSSLTSVTIPNSVTSIGNGAFNGCSGLTSVEIPNSVTSIGRWAFSSCTSLSSLFIPQSIYSIDESAFLNCTGLESIVVDFGNPKYDSRDNCNAIIETETNKLIVGSRNTVIPQSVTDYGQYGLANCVKLTLPEGIEEIPTLYYCKVLESITIPNSIKKIYDHSFDGCSSLKTIIIEDGTEELLFDPLYTYSGYKPQWFKDSPIDSIYLGRVIRPKYSEYDYLPFRELGTLRTIVLGDHIIDIPSHFFRAVQTCAQLGCLKILRV